MQRNSGIDILRFFLAIMIVGLHTPLPDWYIPIGRCAVPTFFIISGFLLLSDENPEMRLRRAIKRMLWLCCWSSTLYIFLRYVGVLPRLDSSPLWKTALKLIIFNDCDAFNGALWYIFAYLYALVAILICVKVKIIRYLYVVSPTLFVIGICCGYYSPLFFGRSLYFLLVRNWLFTALPLVSLGMYLRSKMSKLSDVNKAHIIMILAIGLIGSYFEHYLFNYLGFWGTGDIYFSTIIISLPLVCLSITNQNNSIKHSKLKCALANGGKELSMYIYILHGISISLISNLSHYDNMGVLIKNSLIKFLFILIVTFGLSFIFAKTPIHKVLK